MNDLVGHARGVVEGRRVGGFRAAATPAKPSSDADESDVVADKRAPDRLSRPARVHSVNEAMGPDHDILDGF